MASWGDSSFDTISLSGVNFILDSSIISKTYIATHTFGGNGTFNISLELPNRTGGILNIPNSINVPFYIETQIIINSFVGANNSPDFTSPAIAKSYINNIITYNSNAIDLDGDSISYKLTNCRGSSGLPIGGYSLPFTNNLFLLDSITGNLIWDSPIVSGDYNIAILIEEWRQGIKIGSIIRDVQFQIDSGNTGIRNNSEKFEINIFPNPTKDYIYINPNQPINKNSNIELYDRKGKLILRENLYNKNSIYIGNLASGVYILHLINEGEIFTKKIIKE